MKTSLLLLFLAGTAQSVRGQTDTVVMASPRNVVKISPVSLALGQVSTFYERVLTDLISLVVGIGFGTQRYKYENNSTAVPSPGRFHYERLTLEGRYYLTPRSRAPIGFYVGPYLRCARLSLDDYLYDGKGAFLRDQTGDLVKEERQMTVLIPGVLGGYQTTIGRHLTFELFLGLQGILPSRNKPYTPSFPEAMSTAGLGVRLGLTTGYRF